MPYQEKKLYSCHRRLMGSVFVLGVIHNSKEKADEILKLGIAEIERIEANLSEFLPLSDTSRINCRASISPTVVCSETFSLLQRCKQLWELTSGSFDITAAKIKEHYHYTQGNTASYKPELAAKSTSYVGSEHMILDETNQSLFFKQAGMKISFASIGKGYAADMVKKLWKRVGVQDGFVNASGDLCAWGNNEHQKHWNIGIANPDNPGEILLNLPLKDSAIATSGDYQQFFEYQRVRYSHHINPTNGQATSKLKSVSVMSPSAEFSDALSTAVMVLGSTKGMKLLNKLAYVEGILIDQNNHLLFSKNINYQSPQITI